MSKILVIDDEEGFRYTLKRILEGAGHWVCEAEDGEDGLKKAVSLQPDLVITDWTMPKQDGLQVCLQLKSNASTRHIPIALVTGKKNTPADMELWQKTGADLYISKPILDVREFLKSLGGLLHGLSGRKSREVVSCGILIVNRKERLVSWNGTTYNNLPTKLFELLYYLVKRAPRVTSRMQLIEKVWGEDAVKDREVDVAISRLRKMIPPLADFLECIPSVGYALSSSLANAHGLKDAGKKSKPQAAR